jgi:Flp pilus assembly protein TadG
MSSPADASPTAPRVAQTRDRGAALISLVVATGVVLILLTGIVQVITFQYGKGTVRAALDEGARAGSRSSDVVAACQARAADVLGDLLGGPMGDGVTVSCADAGDRVVATAVVHFDGWFGRLTGYDATLTASAAKEGQ